MKIIIQKPDLDTCLAALLLNVSDKDDIKVVVDRANEMDIQNPSIICIECGGSGLVELNNFDHHDPNKYFPPACLQAYKKINCNDKRLKRLVEYVCIIDDRFSEIPTIPFPSLSNIFSGMLILEKDIRNQLLRGIDILKKVIKNNIDPFSTMPNLKEWIDYRNAKKENIEKVDMAIKNALFFYSKRGLKIGFLESDFIGGIGALYNKGCQVVVLYNPTFGEPPRPKFTIAGNNKKIANLLPLLEEIEKGWGGRETIIGSPKIGSKLKIEEVLNIILKNL